MVFCKLKQKISVVEISNFDLLDKEYQESVAKHKEKLYQEKRKILQSKWPVGPNQNVVMIDEWKRLKAIADKEMAEKAKEYEKEIFKDYEGSRKNAYNQKLKEERSQDIREQFRQVNEQQKKNSRSR